MARMHLFARIPLFAAGVVLIAFGIALLTKGMLGSSPIAAIPYSLSLYWHVFSFGNWVIIYNLSLVLLEWLLLKKRMKMYDLLMQCCLAFCFGYCIDLSMLVLAQFSPAGYAQQIGFVFAGCSLMAIGVCLDIQADISLLPGDGFVLALAKVWNMNYGKMRLLSDIAMSLTAFLICLCLMGNFHGVREGTVIAAIVTGIFVMLLLKTISVCKKLIRNH